MVSGSARWFVLLLSSALLASTTLGCNRGVGSSTPAERTGIASTSTPRTPPTSASAVARTAGAPTPLAAGRATLTPSVRANVDTTRVEWDASAVVQRPDAYYRLPCPAAVDASRGNSGLVFSVDTPAQLECVVRALGEAGASGGDAASQLAAQFLQRQGVFLVAFEEHERVDSGSTSAAWQNMGRPELALLNSMLPLRVLVGAGSDSLSRQWIEHPAYAAALGGSRDAIAWPEYAALRPEPPISEAASAGQRFVAELPLRTCRACANLATLRVAFLFDAQGGYMGWELWPPGPPPPASGAR